MACILYTSGSTSNPKGVQLQHYALIENMWGIGERMHLRAGDRLWLAVSLFWGLGCENALFALMTHAGTIVLQERFEAGEAIDLIEGEGCTVVYATANMVRAIAEHPGFRRSARVASHRGHHRHPGAGPAPRRSRRARDLQRLRPHRDLRELHGHRRARSARAAGGLGGAAPPGVELAIEDPETRRLLPAGEVGEIKVRGYVTCGYYRAEDKNREAFDDEGWFLTGDLGYLDESGRLHFRGRLKEMIKTGGINVAPSRWRRS